MKKLLAFALVVAVASCYSADSTPSDPSENTAVSQQALCFSHGECADNDVCTEDLCLLAACVNLPVLGCCTQDSECEDQDLCLVGQCLLNTCGIGLNLLCESDEANCGAEGYECKNGRECVDGRCTPEWMPLETTGAPSGRFAASATEFEGQYVITGGCTSTSEAAASPDASAYNVANDSWTILADMNHGRAFHTSVTVESGTTVYGGLTTCNDPESADLDFEKLADLEDEEWTEIARNWTAGYNIGSIKLDVDDVFMYGGGDGTTTLLEARQGSPAVYLSWSDQPCAEEGFYSGIANCGRKQPIVFLDKGFEDRPIIRILGGDPTYGIPDDEALVFDVLSHDWEAVASPDDYPSHSAITHDTSTMTLDSIPTGPRVADDGRRVYVMDTSGDVHIYDKETDSWSVDDPTPPMGFCPEAPVVWIDGEMIAYSGICGGTISTVGGRYQPAAPEPLP